VVACLERESRFSCLGERPDGWSRERQQKKNQKPGEARLEKQIRFRVFFFFIPLNLQNYPSSLLKAKPLFIGKILFDSFWSKTSSLNFFFIFINLIFLIFLDFSYQH
jgi:hypothetical protein